MKLVCLLVALSGLAGCAGGPDGVEAAPPAARLDGVTVPKLDGSSKDSGYSSEEAWLVDHPIWSHEEANAAPDPDESDDTDSDGDASSSP
jgi:hypothetical protein